MTQAHRPEPAIEPEAAANGRPVVPSMFGILTELAGILPGLKAAIERLARLTEPPVAYRKEQAARLVGISPRLVERLLAAGKFPRPDAYAGRCPLWRRETLEKWVANGGGSI
jgi:hypothetical protein